MASRSERILDKSDSNDNDGRVFAEKQMQRSVPTSNHVVGESIGDTVGKQWRTISPSSITGREDARSDGWEDGSTIGHPVFRKAPIVGWQNGSPTVFPSSPCCSSDPDTPETFYRPGTRTSSSRTSGICQDSGNTEDLSSIADEKLLRSTPAWTIDRSVESLSPDKDTLLTTSPEFGRSKEFSLGDESECKIDLVSPVTEFTEEKLSPRDFTQSWSISPNGTTDAVDSATERSEPADLITNPECSPEEDCLRERLLKSEERIGEPREEDNSGRRIARDGSGEIAGNRSCVDEVERNVRGCQSILDIEDDVDLRGKGQVRRNKPKVPDGGWGWVVVLSSLLVSMIADGVSFSFGLLYIEFLHEFGETKSRTAWIGSLFMAVPLLSGPIMSAFVDRYGCRRMTIAGGLISGTGFVLSSFSNSIEVMYLTFGLIAGLGLGLCYVTAVVSIAYWFDKKRTLAVSLGASGTGIGTFVYAPMTSYFIAEYGWRGTCLLLAGTFFNMIVCGAVMRDPEWWIIEQRKQLERTSGTPKKSGARSECDRSSAGPVDEFPGVEELRRLLKKGHAPEYLLQHLSTSTVAPNGLNGSAFRSVVNLPTFVKQSEKVPLEVLESLSSNSRLYSVILENYPSLLLCRSVSDKKLHDSNEDNCNNKNGVTMSMRLKQVEEKSGRVPLEILAARRTDRKGSSLEANPLLAKGPAAQAIVESNRTKSSAKHHPAECNGTVVRTDSIPWLRRQFSTNTHYFKDIRVHRNSVMYRGAALNLNKYRLRASSCPDIYRNSITTLAKESEKKWYTELVDLLKGMMDFSMFLELHFLLLSLSTILLYTWFIVPYFYLAEHLTRNGYSESDAANLLSIIGITNTIGMVGLGWSPAQPRMNVSKTYAWCLAACGIATILMSAFTLNYDLLITTSAAFGLFFASSFSFTPVLLVELIPLERFTTAYGLTLLCQGIGNLLGPPLAGWMFDITGSWELSFLMAGGYIIISGVLVGLIPYTRNRKIWGSGPVEMEREKDCFA